MNLMNLHELVKVTSSRPKLMKPMGKWTWWTCTEVFASAGSCIPIGRWLESGERDEQGERRECREHVENCDVHAYPHETKRLV